MHPLDVVRSVSFTRQIWLNCFIQDRYECDDVPEGHVRSRMDPVDLVLLETRVSQGNFVLISEPVLIVGTEARIKNPLFKAKVALRKVIRNGVSLESARVAGEMRK